MTTTPSEPLEEPTTIPPGAEPDSDPLTPKTPHEDPQTRPNV